MKLRDIRLVVPALLAVCAACSASWTSDVCGCIPAWASLRESLQLPYQNYRSVDDLTLIDVRTGSRRLLGRPLNLSELPDTGSGTSCRTVPTGARCEWKLSFRGPQAKGYSAEFSTDRTGRITSVDVRERLWDSSAPDDATPSTSDPSRLTAR